MCVLNVGKNVLLFYMTKLRSTRVSVFYFYFDRYTFNYVYYRPRWKFTTGAVPCQYRRRISGTGAVPGYTPNDNSAGSWQSELGWYLKAVLVQYYQSVLAILISTAPVVSQYYNNVWHSIDRQHWHYSSVTTGTVLRQL